MLRPGSPDLGSPDLGSRDPGSPAWPDSLEDLGSRRR